ncbi:MAG: class I SAM-dependent methyltransferase [Candidatus Dormibacteraeota bacterium]|nr:class I SAM-dependent methyltransferase [Candidatus Dormibacteraeota bacterium]
MAARPPPERRKGDYGFDAPYVPLLLSLGDLVMLAAAAVKLIGGSVAWALFCVLCAAGLLASAASYLYTTRRGKFSVWSTLLNGLEMRGNEQLLDLGCGRGAVLLMGAQLVPRGRAVGVDLWKSADQSGNAIETTRRNAELEGVAETVQLETADMRDLPFPNSSFDLVVSSIAIHNVNDSRERERCIDEAVRVLRPGGQLLVADIRFAGQYVERLRHLAMAEVESRPLGWRFWYGGPWVAASLVSCVKPG